MASTRVRAGGEVSPPWLDAASINRVIIRKRRIRRVLFVICFAMAVKLAYRPWVVNAVRVCRGNSFFD